MANPVGDNSTLNAGESIDVDGLNRSLQELAAKGMEVQKGIKVGKIANQVLTTG